MRGPIPRPLADRFWLKVSKGAADACWLWTGSKTSNGYGKIKGPKHKLLHASRVSWELHTGAPIPTKLFVCHTCDTPLCVNPAHLWLGTQRDNIQDMIAKGRWKRTPRRTHCARGHALSDLNLITQKNGDHACRQCHLATKRRYYERQKAK